VFLAWPEASELRSEISLALTQGAGSYLQSSCQLAVRSQAAFADDPVAANPVVGTEVQTMKQNGLLRATCSCPFLPR